MPQQLQRPDARTIKRSQALESAEASQVLWAAGDLLRESDAEGHVEARAALACVTPQAAREAVGAIDASGCARGLAGALEHAFDAALEQDQEERVLLEMDAMEGLEQRDVVDCVLRAVATFDGRHDLDPEEAASLQAAASELSGALSASDAAARPGARTLTALNARRRKRADLLDDAARASAWWWSELAGEENDGLVERLAGLDVEAGAAAIRDAARSEVPGERESLGAALRALHEGGPSTADAERWAESAARRSEADAIALELTRSLDVERIDEDALA